MKYVSVDRLKEGDIIARGLEPFIKANTPLTNIKIDWLKKQGKKGVYIKSDLENDTPQIVETLPEKLQQSAIYAIYGKDIEAVIENAKQIVECIYAEKNPEFDIWNIIDSDYKTHPLHVCEFALATAKKAGYKDEKLLDVAVASLLHDIGKELNLVEMKKIISENKQLISKMNPAIEKSQQNLHTVFSYGYLKDSPHINAVVKNAILYHHENENGTGLFGKKGDEIKEIAALIHICDDYEFSLRAYEDPIMARNQIRMGVTYKLYNNEIALKFLNAIPLYPIGTLVNLSNDLVGTIYEQSEDMERPIIKLETGEIIDLNQINNVTIKSLVGENEDIIERTL